MGEKNAPVEYVRIPFVIKSPSLVLASNSPRRRELLGLTGWKFQVRPAEVDERPQPGEIPSHYVMRLAEEKARVCAGSALPGETIIAADTTVTVEGAILGKPQDAGEAITMLQRLRGRSHQVCTGIAVLDNETGRFVPDLCVTEVPMRDYSDEEIREYVQSGDPLDKAGAYAIQHPGFHPVVSLAGCHASVMGLPLCHLSRSLGKVDIHSRTDLPAACQTTLQYDCPIHARVLSGKEIG